MSKICINKHRSFFISSTNFNQLQYNYICPMQRKIKVCHITTLHPAKDTRIFHKQCVSLAANGFDVKLIVANQQSEICQEVEIINIEIPKSRRERMLKASKIVMQKALEIDAAVYQFHDPELLPVGLKLVQQGKIVVYDAHEDVPIQMLNKPWIPKLIRPISSKAFKKYENRIASKLSAVVVASPSMIARFKSVNDNTMDICNFPILSEFSETPDWNEREDAACYVGRIDAARGIHTMMEAIQQSQSKFHLAGWFGSDELKMEVENSEGWKHTVFHGMQDRMGVQNVLAKSKIGLVTLKPLPNYKLALAVKMFEYMGAGIPIIASNFELWKDIVETNKCGMIVDPENATEIAEAIQYLLQHPSIAEEMGKNGKAAVQEIYNWKTQEEKLIGLYEQLLAKTA